MDLQKLLHIYYRQKQGLKKILLHPDSSGKKLAISMLEKNINQLEEKIENFIPEKLKNEISKF